MMMTVMRVTISRRDTADTTITDEILSLHVSLFSITDVGSSCISVLTEIYRYRFMIAYLVSAIYIYIYIYIYTVTIQIPLLVLA